MTRGPFEKGLARMHDVMSGHVERGALPGLIALVAHQGRVHVEVIGTMAFAAREPMRRDAIFRIASLTKPIAAVAAMILVEDGSLQLDAPIDPWLPELGNRRVLRSLDADLDDTVPANRPITLEDLLSFRLGFGTVMAPPNTYPIQAAEAELQLRTLGPPWPPTPHTPDEWIRRFGSLPLMHQPGERWLYNTGAQVLGVLLERAAGKPLESLLRDRIFEPLGMRDTGFSVSCNQRDRLTTAYATDPESGTWHVLDGVADSYWSSPPAFPSAAGWLVSTIDDYWAFVQMMTGRGAYQRPTIRVDLDDSSPFGRLLIAVTDPRGRRSMSDEDLAGRAVLGGHLRDQFRLETALHEKTQPVLATEQAQAVGVLHGPDRTVGIAQQKRVVRQRPGVGRVRVPSPLQVAHRPTVDAIVPGVIGARLEGFARMVRHKDRRAAGAAVHKGGVDGLPEIGLGRHVLDRVVNEHRVEAAPEPHRAHVAALVFALGVEPP